ncbi:MAG: nitroreductase [bacterium]|nr:nitroreductase [bacterium]
MPLQFLLKRRSVVASQLQEPGPDKTQIKELIRAAIRVPDHKALTPWRFLVFTDDARAQFGEATANIYKNVHKGEFLPRHLVVERNRFLRAPVVIAVISNPVESEKVPTSEQLLSAGASCQNILHAARALGFSGQWITEWIAYDPQVAALLRLKKAESVAGFLYIGTSANEPKERPRVEPEDMMSYWKS